MYVNLGYVLVKYVLIVMLCIPFPTFSLLFWGVVSWEICSDAERVGSVCGYMFVLFLLPLLVFIWHMTQLKTKMILFLSSSYLSARLASWSAWWCGDARANSIAVKKWLGWKPAGSPSFPSYHSGDSPDFKQTEGLYSELRLVHMQKIQLLENIIIDLFSKIYQDIMLVLGDEIAVSHWDSSSRSRIDPRTHCAGKTTLWEFCHSRGAGLRTVPDKNRSTVPLVSAGLLVGSARKWDLCRLCDWREGSLARGFVGLAVYGISAVQGKQQQYVLGIFFYFVSGGLWFFLNDFLVFR